MQDNTFWNDFSNFVSKMFIKVKVKFDYEGFYEKFLNTDVAFASGKLSMKI